MQLIQSNWSPSVWQKRQLVPIAMYWWAFVDICLTLVLYLMQSFCMSTMALPINGTSNHATFAEENPNFPTQLQIVLTDRTIELNQEVISHFDGHERQAYDLDRSGCITQLLRKLLLIELEQQTSFQSPKQPQQIPLVQTSIRTPFHILHHTLNTLACAGFSQSTMLTME